MIGMCSSIWAALAIMLISPISPISADPGVSPALVQQELAPGSSFHVNKHISTPKLLPQPDVVLLVDATGSMQDSNNNIKANLRALISAVDAVQPNAHFAVTAVNSMRALGGGDWPEDWINALYKISTGATTFREGSSRIIVLVGDATSHDPSGGHSQGDAIDALKKASIRVLGVNVGALDEGGRATQITAATGGAMVGSRPDEATKAIIDGLQNLNVTITPEVVSCDAGLTVRFAPTETLVSSGATATLVETAELASDAGGGVDAPFNCSVRFLINGAPGGDAFVQKVQVTVKQPVATCLTCIPVPGQNLCHESTTCNPTPFGNMCLAAPGKKADGAADADLGTHWRLIWPGPNQHRVMVKPGVAATTDCLETVGSKVCDEILIAECKPTALDAVVEENTGKDQVVVGDGEL
ncbi:hypothetical protein N658DRAFT_502889 [Parathielavia hyrcaniae]|uniref:VWFA domain-containing protein n=1 Tax=Parathielavia hyrcaniae TaxID=113614 RepID=A0AAN6QA17_9PEZI|nr:hypothetical protein N658DRAFT_502889 [Parathielavia hyrcaniae]